MEEVEDVMRRALECPVTLVFSDADEAKSWVFRAHNYRNRHAPHYKRLMISRRGASVRIKLPTPYMETGQ